VVVVSPPRAYDVAILGATGFTGRLAAEYMTNAYGRTGVRWLVAGRNEAKLAKLQADLGLDEAHMRIVDCMDESAVTALVKEVAVVANFAGTPFIDKALPVVAACSKHGTNYIDITGEVPLHRASYDRYHAQSQASKALIVHSCGYDSIPSDLGAFLAVRKLRDNFGCGCCELKAFAGDSKGGVSGGTIATALGGITGKIKGMPGVAEAAARGAYALDPEGATGGPDSTDFHFRVRYDDRVGSWHMPNVMASVNAPVVRKSAALLEYSSERGRCSYSEVSAVSSLAKAWLGTAIMAVGGLCLLAPPTRALLFKAKVLPRPGEGPSQETRESGFFHTYVLGVGEIAGDAADGTAPPMVIADVKSGSAGDPGYKGTAQMAMESALCLALQRDECLAEGGVLTPAVAMGDAIVARLNRSGMDLSVRVLS